MTCPDFDDLAAATCIVTTTTGPPAQVTLCHATGSEQNPYVEITVDDNSVQLEGHQGHEGDIIPAPEGGCPGPTTTTTAPTTTVADTTTTTPGDTTTTEAAGPAETITTEVGQPFAASSDLPQTGGGVGLAAPGLSALLLGSVLLAAARRRRTA